MYLFLLCIFNELLSGLNHLLSLQDLAVVATLMILIVSAGLLGQHSLLTVDLLTADYPHRLLKSLRHQSQLVAEHL